MLNVLNEMLHDLSKKVNIGFRAKECRGNRLRQRRCSAISDPEDKNHWVIEPETAEIVRRIFELAATGMNPHRIAKPYRQSGGLHRVHISADRYGGTDITPEGRKQAISDWQ